VREQKSLQKTESKKRDKTPLPEFVTTREDLVNMYQNKFDLNV